VKKSRFTEEKIISIIREADAGVKVIDLCRKHGMSDASFYKWKARYGGLSS
jgi:putative transposase